MNSINKNYNTKKVELNHQEQNLWENGFSAFKRRINQQLQLDNADILADDEDLKYFYRVGESETYVLTALGYAFA